MAQIQILRIMVASPNDVQTERDKLPDVIDELNRGLAGDRGLRLELSRWETDTYPGFHLKGPQGLIDPILKIADCDLLIGIFWKRFGTPISDGKTGTEHEILTAYEAWKERGSPQIFVYFNQMPYMPNSPEEMKQWRKVIEFRNRFPKEGLWWPYEGEVQFEKLVRNHLTNYIRNLPKPGVDNQSVHKLIDQVRAPGGSHVSAHRGGVVHRDNAESAIISTGLVDSPMVNMMVVGIGGGGCNAVDHMIETRIRGLKYLAVCTDVQTLKKSKASHKLQIGSKLTKGLSTGGISEIGRDAALEDTEKILEALEGMDMVVIVAGLGGGTGNGAAPIIASLAYELDALTVAVVTNPLPFERYRQRQAECSLEELRSVVDTLITIPNEWLLQDLSRNMTLSEAFTMANSVLSQAVQGISDLITMPGSIKLNFTDLRAFMKGMGVARLGIGHAMGESRVMDATRLAISSPLPETASINAARSVLINFRSGTDVTLFEVDQAVKMIYDATGPHAHIIFGTILDERMQNEMRVTVMAYVMQQ